MKYDPVEQRFIEPAKTDDIVSAVLMGIFWLGGWLLLAIFLLPPVDRPFHALSVVALIASVINLFWSLNDGDKHGTVVATTFVACTALATIFAPEKNWEHKHRPICASNLKNLGQALQNYATAKDRFPPAFTVDANGNRLHSWRTLLLPYLNRADLYHHIDLKEPWNSSQYGFLTKIQFDQFECPSDKKRQHGETSYVAIIGPGTVWENGKRIGPQDIRDGLENTILLVEMQNSGIAWAEPRDLDLDNLPPGITTANLLTSLSNHPGGFMALFADGKTRFVDNTIPWAQFKAMLTIAGGETIEPQWKGM